LDAERKLLRPFRACVFGGHCTQGFALGCRTSLLRSLQAPDPYAFSSSAAAAVEEYLPDLRVMEMSTERDYSEPGMVRCYRMLIILTGSNAPAPEVIDEMERAITNDGSAITDIRVEFFQTDVLMY